MFAAVGIALVLVVFLVGVVVLTMTLLGAREQAQEASRVQPGQGSAPLPPKQAGAVLRQVADAEIEREIRLGRVTNAVTLYQEKTGVGLSEARDAVEAWRARLSAS